VLSAKESLEFSTFPSLLLFVTLFRVALNVASTRLILAGSAVLEERFASPKLDAFSQRLAARCYLESLNREETQAYIHAQIHTATAWGGGPDLARLAGYATAMELLASARVVPADEARALGLVNRVAPAGVDLLEFVDRFLEPMQQRPPHVMRALKAQVLAERFGWPVEVRREAEREHFVRTWLDPAHWTAVDDRFAPPADRG
jgi:enoyl-CoA hydratase/carnithine racemase